MRIGALAAEAGLSTKAIRFYERTGLLPAPPRTDAGYRDYPRETLDRLVFIRNAKACGMTLVEVRDILAIRDAGNAPCRYVTELIDQHLGQVEQRIAELAHTGAVLRELRARAAVTDPADCARTDICSILTRPPRPPAP